jgi:nitrogen regulatory protein PII
VRGFGRTVGRGGSQSGINNPIYGTVNMAKVECVVDDDMLGEIIEVITKAAHTGLPGDGKIVIYDVSEMVKIRTGERGKRVT